MERNFGGVAVRERIGDGRETGETCYEGKEFWGSIWL